MTIELSTKLLDNMTFAKALKLQAEDRAQIAADRAAKGQPPKVYKAKKENRVDLCDSIVTGLTARVTKRAGRIAFTMTYVSPTSGKQKREPLGFYGRAENGAVPLAVARAKGSDLKEGVHNKVDPQVARLAAAPSRTFGEVMEMRLATQVMGKCKEDAKIKLRYQTTFAKILALPIKAFKIDPHYNDLIAANEARHQRRSVEKIRSDLSAIFEFAKGKQFVDFNPIPKREKRKGGAYGSNRRARALSPQEIVAVWRAVEDGALPPHMALIIMLMICLGQRCGEICGMRNSEIVENSPTDWVWTIPGDIRNPQTDVLIQAGRTKNGKFHAVPLSPLAIKLVKLAREQANGNDEFFATLYQGRMKSTRTQNVGAAIWFARNRLDVDPFGIGDWTVHMLRHTVVTGMTELDCAPGAISKVVNHSMGEAATEEKTGSGWGSAVTKGYTHTTALLAARELKAKREALDLWGQTVADLVGEDLTAPMLKLVA